MDLFKIATGLSSPDTRMRLRFGKVASVQSNRTITVTIAGSTDTVAGIKYLESVAPKPNAVVLLLTDGVDLFALGHLAAANMTIAPRAYRTGDQTITSGTWTDITWQDVENDPWTCWASGVPARLTAPITGRYQAVLSARFAANATGDRGAAIANNTGTELATVLMRASATATSAMSVTTTPFDMTAGDYITSRVYQDSGVNLALSRGSTFNPALSLTYLG